MRKIRILESIFLQNKNWLREQDFVDKTLRLVRISLLISAIQRGVLRFFSGKLFYKSNRKLFSCVCISWYKHSRGWENSRQLCKPSTSSRVCITVSNSPNSSRVYVRLCKHGKRFLLLKYEHTRCRIVPPFFNMRPQKSLPSERLCDLIRMILGMNHFNFLHLNVHCEVCAYSRFCETKELKGENNSVRHSLFCLPPTTYWWASSCILGNQWLKRFHRVSAWLRVIWQIYEFCSSGSKCPEKNRHFARCLRSAVLHI